MDVKSNRQILYYIAFFLMIFNFQPGCYVYIDSLKTIIEIIYKLTYVASLGLYGILIVWRFVDIVKEKDKKGFLLLLIFGASLILAYFKMPIAYLLILCSIYLYKLADTKRLLYITSIGMLIWIAIWIVMYPTNFIVHNEYYGFTYKNVTGFLLLFTSLCFCMLLNEKRKILGISILFVSTLISYTVFHSRTPLYIAIIFIFVYLFFAIYFNKLNRIENINKIISILFCMLPVIMLILSIYLSNYFSINGGVDATFMVRFLEYKSYINTYSIKLLGNTIYFNREFNGLYLCGDNLYFRYLFQFGLVICLYAFVCCFVINKRIYSTKSPLLIALIFSLNAYFMMETVYYFFIFIALGLSYVDYLNNKECTKASTINKQ